jgi:branched-chain amino acid transport system ATP-binding protein
MTTILSIQDVSKEFSGLEVLSEIKLEIASGERRAIIGPNGAGKTTLFNIITGMYRPSRGRIHFYDKDITGWAPHRIVKLGLVRSFQIITVFPKMSVFENVRSSVVSKLSMRNNCATWLNRNEKVAAETARIVTLLGLGDVPEIPASDLSYGKQRQLELALTMALDPTIIMLDEPTAGLNSQETRHIVSLIRQLTEGKTLVMVEHDMDVVFNLADRITVLKDGRTLITGTPGEIRENEEVQKAYLGRK